MTWTGSEVRTILKYGEDMMRYGEASRPMWTTTEFVPVSNDVSDDMRDAARYQWLMEDATEAQWDTIKKLSPECANAFIDGAISVKHE